MSNHHKITNSSSITHIDYHSDKSTLEICFASGGVYHYPSCPYSEYEALKASGSPGKHFHTRIKGTYEGFKQ